jgi:hypothetical protein
MRKVEEEKTAALAKGAVNMRKHLEAERNRAEEDAAEVEKKTNTLAKTKTPLEDVAVENKEVKVDA